MLRYRHWFRSIERRRRNSPHFLVFLWFGGIIVVGSLLLWSPLSHRPGGPGVTFLDAFFTATSAASVTGLAVVNTGNAFSFFGQAVICLLLEMGGLGIMTFANLGFRMFRRRFSMSQQAALADSLFQSDSAREFSRSFRRMLRVTLTIQAMGAVVMFLSLIPRHMDLHGGLLFAAWSAVFHSVSAFCNGGFMIYPEGMDNLLGNVPFLVVTMILITLGGLGHIVLTELWQLPRLIRKTITKPHWISLHTRVVLIVTSIVMVVGTAGIWIFGAGPTHSFLHAVFQAVGGRTAGFNTVPVGLIPLPSILILIALMFIGGSPGSCAGGIKTTSLAIWIARIRSNLRGDANVNIFGYTIAPDLVSRARILMALTLIWNCFGVFILVVLHPGERLETLIFEQVSAFGTVGLSMDFTPRLETLSRLWIMLTMFMGRLGPLSLILWVAPPAKAKIGRPVARVMVG